MTATRSDVEAAALAAFPHGDAATILALLDLYGTEPHEREKERVQLAVIALSQGSEEKLLELVQTAKTDYRDILAWVETGPLPESEGLAQQQRAHDLLDKWGREQALMPIEPPLALLFDMGGVVIDIDFERAFRAWEPRSRLLLEQIRQAFQFDLPYQRHERGEIAAEDYYDHLAAALAIEADRAFIANGWNAIYVDEISETVAMLHAARRTVPCYAFTNTNAAHAATWTAMFPRVVTAFDHIFCSHEIGLRKPERRAFEHIARTIGVAPGSIVFFDDMLENVQGASVAGLQAVHVRSPEDVRRALEAIGHAP